MTKQEFDKASTEAGFGPCSEEMWREIERVYSTSDEIDRALMVDIYWHEPVVYRNILYLREEIKRQIGLAYTSSHGYRFPEVRGRIQQITLLNKDLSNVIADAKLRRDERINERKAEG